MVGFKTFFKVTLFALLALSLWNGKVFAEPPKGYKFGGYDDAIQRAKKSGKKIFLYYGRHGCGFCDMTNKKSFSKTSVRLRYQKHYELVYVDAEGGERMTLVSGERITEQQFGAKQKVLGTPYFLFLEPDGTPIYKAPGFKTEQDLIMLDDFVYKNHYKTKSYNEFSKEHAS